MAMQLLLNLARTEPLTASLVSRSSLASSVSLLDASICCMPKTRSQRFSYLFLGSVVAGSVSLLMTAWFFFSCSPLFNSCSLSFTSVFASFMALCCIQLMLFASFDHSASPTPCFARCNRSSLCCFCKRGQNTEFFWENRHLLHDTLKPGDIVRFPRSVYYHYGIYAGGCMLIHQVANNGGEVVRQMFWDVVHDSRAEIANFLDGECMPYSPENVVQNARERLGERGYHLVKNNCEHFVTSCRYGRGVSQQSDRLRTLIGGSRPSAPEMSDQSGTDSESSGED